MGVVIVVGVWYFTRSPNGVVPEPTPEMPPMVAVITAPPAVSPKDTPAVPETPVAKQPTPPVPTASKLLGDAGPLYESVGTPEAKVLGADVALGVNDPTPAKPPLRRTLPSGTNAFFVAVAFQKEPAAREIRIDVVNERGAVEMLGGTLLEMRNNATGAYTLLMGRKAKTRAFEDGVYRAHIVLDGQIVAHVNWSIGGQAPKSASPTPAPPSTFAGEWVASQRYDGANVIITLTVEPNGHAGYLRTADLGNGRFEVGITKQPSQIEPREGGHTLKLLNGTYRCQLSDAGRLELTLLHGTGPKTWSFGRVNK